MPCAKGEPAAYRTSGSDIVAICIRAHEVRPVRYTRIAISAVRASAAVVKFGVASGEVLFHSEDLGGRHYGSLLDVAGQDACLPQLLCAAAQVRQF